MWESCYAASEIDPTETDLFPWRSPTPNSRIPTAYLSPPLSISTKRRGFTYRSNKPGVIGAPEEQQQSVLQAYRRQDDVYTVGMDATPLYASIPSGIPIEGSTYRGPSEYPAHQQGGESYHPHYLQHHPIDEQQHAGHGLSVSAPDATEAWNMQQHQQQLQSRAPNWIYPGSIERSHSGQDPALTSQNVSLIRYPSEETGAELTKEEKRTRRKEQNRLAQQDLRRRRMEHTHNLETRVEELVRMLDKKDNEIKMLQDIVKQLQRGGKSDESTSSHPSADDLRDASALMSPTERLQVLPTLATERSQAVRPIVARKTSTDDPHLRLDIHPPSYSPFSLASTSAEAPAFGEGSSFSKQGHAVRYPEIWSAPAGTVEFPTDVQHRPSASQAQPDTTYQDRRPSIVGYTGFEPYPTGRLGMTNELSHVQQYHQQHPQHQLDQQRQRQHPAMRRTTYNQHTQAGFDVKRQHDYSLYPEQGSLNKPPTAHMQGAKPVSTFSEASSIMPSMSDADETVVQGRPYERKTEGFVYPVNQVFPSPGHPPQR